MSRLYTSFLVVLLFTCFHFAKAGCPVGNLDLAHQSDVDSYASSSWGGCSVISGDLYISDAGDGPDNQIFNLSGLAMITEVQGYVYITSSSLESLSGLDNLTRIGAVLTIETNSRLQSLEGLGALSDVQYIYIVDNSGLTDLTALTGLSSLIGLNIENNASLASLKGFEGLTTIHPFGIDIDNNPLLESLDGFKNVTNTNYIRIENNLKLSSITGLNKIQSAPSQVYIFNNPDLVTCDPVCNFLKLQSTGGGTIEISNNGASCQSVEQMMVYCESLPVTLASFSAKKERQSVKLYWTTTQEANSKDFIIQHSENGKSWKNIGTLQAMSESNKPTNYDFTHNMPSEANYYRLKMTDHDNSFTFSSIKQIHFPGAQKMVALYPNPASEYVSIHPSLAGRIKRVTIFNNAGTVVFDSASQISPVINIRHLKSGLYSIRLVDKDNSEKTQKLAIAR